MLSLSGAVGLATQRNGQTRLVLLHHHPRYTTSINDFSFHVTYPPLLKSLVAATFAFVI